MLSKLSFSTSFSASSAWKIAEILGVPREMFFLFPCRLCSFPACNSCDVKDNPWRVSHSRLCPCFGLGSTWSTFEETPLDSFVEFVGIVLHAL